MAYLPQGELEKKHALVALMIKLSQKDGKIDPRETRFLKDMALYMGLSEEDINMVTENPSQFPLIPPKKEQDRMEMLYHLLFLMKIDGNVDKEEARLVEFIGLRLGFRPEMTRELTEIMRNNIAKQVPPEHMLETIKKYMN